MDRGRAERLEELFDRGLPLETAERRSLLDDVRRGDAELADELASLFTAHEAPGRLEDLAAQLFPDVLDDLSRTLAGNVENLPSVVGHYQLLEPLGQGGMGEVYRARDLSLDRLVALKFLAPHLAADAEARARLKREARAASALDHPNIAVVHEIGTTAVEPDGSGAGRLFIAMAYYSGETIKKKLTRGSLAVADAIDYAAQTADGLAAAHEAGIVHRDIKPANVIVTSRGVAKIVDFGIARSAGSGLTGEGGLLGTIAYMSPEQTRGEPVDCRTDVWSLGAMVYEMLAAQRPFRGDDDAVVIHAIRHDEPKPLLRIRPGIPATLARIIDICLAKDPDARFQHAGALLAALKALQAGDVSEPLVTAPRRLKIRPALRIPILIVFLLAIAGAVLRPEVFGQLLGRAGHPPIVSPDSRMVLVLPFAPASPDPTLERIGRDLAVTLTAGLDGMGALRTVDPTPTLADVASGQPLSRDDAHVTAGRRGAGRFIQGALTRAGGLIRLDLSLYATGGDEAIARASVTGDAPALTDRALIALLDQLWQREPPDAPSVAAIRKSQVPEARRAYLEGELALSRRNMAAALDAFERAFGADPTFWWAYWRSMYPRTYRETRVPADPALVQKVIEHRAELPEPDRLLVEAWATRSRAEQLTRLRELTNRFPDHEAAWWSYANFLTHYGAYHGRPLQEARSALERFLTLNPRFAAAWNHLFSATLFEGDSDAATRAAREDGRWSEDTARRRAWIPVLDLRLEVMRSQSIPPERLSQAVDLVLSRPPGLAETLTSGFVADGSPVAQIQLNRAMRLRRPGPGLEAPLWRGEALAWAARGAWDDAMTAADRWASASGDGDGALGAYRLGVAGVLTGGLKPASAGGRRPTSTRALSRWSDFQKAELLWLDGVLAYLDHNPQRMGAVRRALAADTAPHRPLLDRSLAALAAEAGGDRKGATRTMLELEAEIADRAPIGDLLARYPLLVTANRLLAARWLRSLGEDTEAVRLLAWYESMFPTAVLAAWNSGIGSVDLLDRAEIAELAGDSERARRYFTRFLQRYDRATQALRTRVARASAGLDRLGPRSARVEPVAAGPR